MRTINSHFPLEAYQFWNLEEYFFDICGFQKYVCDFFDCYKLNYWFVLEITLMRVLHFIVFSYFRLAS